MRIIRYSLLFLIVFLVVTASGQTLRIPPNTTETSTVTVTQPSNGVISGWGISCGTSATDCAESFLNFTTVTLTATPDSGAIFNGWSGACADRGTNTTCTLTLSAGVAVAASFTLTTRNLTITKAGTGVGHVYDADFNVICSDSCLSYSHDYPLNTSVTIHAWPTGTDTWGGYSGNCSGTGENPPLHDCTLTMSSNKAVTVTFTTSASFTMYAKASSQGALSTGTCTTIATACTVARAVSLATAGSIIGLLGTNAATDGLYQGANDMLDLVTFAPGHSGTSDTNRITVAAVHEGGVFIDGQFARTPFLVGNGATGVANSYWTFQGFDVGNSGPGNVVGTVASSDHVTIQRMCFSNAYSAFPLHGQEANAHTFLIWNSKNTLVEDVCTFGTGRNSFSTYNDGPFLTTGNTFRRIFVRWEGWPPTGTSEVEPGGFCRLGGVPSGEPIGSAGAPIQISYFQYGDGGSNTYENFISIYNPEQFLASYPDFGCGDIIPGEFQRFSSTQGPDKLLGWILYGYDGFEVPNRTRINHAWNKDVGTNGGFGGVRQYKDIFIDTRSQTGNSESVPFGWDCRDDARCDQNSADRLTSVKLSATTSSVFTGTWQTTTPATNQHECNAAASPTSSLGGCPDFYTGVGTAGAVGARNCFEYTDGTLTSTPLWPWPMDDRIKAALARAHAAGTGGSPLAGAAGTTGSGTGYNANTVTSEIVSRYGAVPAACSR